MKDNARNKYFSVKFTGLLDDWKTNNHKTQEDFVEEIGIASANSVTDWKKGKSFPKKETLERICEVFGVSEDVFYPNTHDDMYKYSSVFTTELANTKIKDFCHEEGIDLQFLCAVRTMFGDEFSKSFPFWAPLIRNHNLMAIIKDEKYYTREDLSIYSPSAPMTEGNDIFQVEIEIEKNGETEKRTIILNNPDLRFIRDLQNDVKDYIEFRFMKRKKELEEEARLASEKSARTLKGGGRTSVKLTGEELSSIDRYAKYIDTEKGVEVEI